MKSSTSRILRPIAAVLRAAAFAFVCLFFASGCESMKDPNGQAMPWGPSNEWEYNQLPPSLFNR